MIIFRFNFKCCHHPTSRPSKLATNHFVYMNTLTYCKVYIAGDAPRLFVAMVTFGSVAAAQAPCAPESGLKL
jgi:hypothetical protein